MILTKQQTAEFLEAAKPLIKFLNENGHPHVKVVVDCTTAEIVEGLAMVETTEFLKY